jgi:hypothetical protein
MIMKYNNQLSRKLAALLMSMGVGVSAWAQEEQTAPPEARITSPGNGVVLEGPRDLTIFAEVDRVGQASVSMEFVGDGTSLGTVDEPLNLIPPQLLTPETPIGPFRFDWENLRGGNHTVQVTARDENGTESISELVSFTIVESIPVNVVTVSATDPEASEPKDGDTLIDTAEFTITRTGSVDHELDVYFRTEGAAEAGLDYLPMSNVVTIPAGERSTVVLLEPLDDLDPEGDESVLVILEPSPCADIFPMPQDCYEVGRLSVAEAVIRDGENPIPNLPPKIAMISPLPGETFLDPASVWLIAQAEDADGQIERVEFFEGTELIISGNFEQPNLYKQFWQNLGPGRYEIVARAYDNEGAYTDSQPHVFHVLSKEEPSIVSVHAEDPEATEPTLMANVDLDSDNEGDKGEKNGDDRGKNGNGQGNANRPENPAPQNKVKPRSLTLAEAAVGGDPGFFVISREGPMDHAIEVAYRLNGRAQNGKDYAELEHSILMDKGVASVRVEIKPLADQLREGPENVILTLIPRECELDRDDAHKCYALGESHQAEVTILDGTGEDGETLPTSLAILSPRNGSVFPSNHNINVVVKLEEGKNDVDSVVLYSGDEPVAKLERNGRGKSPIWSTKLSNLTTGRHNLTAVATNKNGESARSESITVSVQGATRAPLVEVFATDPIATEGFRQKNDGDDNRPEKVNAATWMFRRSGNKDVALNVAYRLSGTATSGDDFAPLSGTIEIPAGVNNVRLQLVPKDDNQTEPTETVVLELLPAICIAIFPPPADCYQLGQHTTAKVEIRDNDQDDNPAPVVKIESPDNGDAFRAPAEIRIEVEAKDQNGWTSQAAFFANGRKIGEQFLTFIRPPEDGEDQHYSLVWSDVPVGKYELQAEVTDDEGKIGRSRPVIVQVRDKSDSDNDNNGNGGNTDGLTLVQVKVDDGKASETGAGEDPNPGSFLIWRQGDLSNALAVHYQMRGAGVNGLDYEHLSGMVTIPEGMSEVQVSVIPLEDNDVEGVEQVVLLLEDIQCIAIFPPSPDCYQVGRQDAARLNIFDNDRDRNIAPKVSMITPFNNEKFQAPASIQLTGEAVDADGWIGAFRFLANDEVVHEGTINFIVAPDPGQSQTFDFLWENVAAGKYDIALEVTDNDGATLMSRRTKVEVIGDNEKPEVTVFAKDAFASEATGNGNGNGSPNGNTAKFRIRRTGKTDTELKVAYRMEGTAENGLDYTLLEGSVIIEAQKRWATLELSPILDDMEEGLETAILVLEPVETYNIGRAGAATVVINDNNPGRKGVSILDDGSIHLRLPAVPGEGYVMEVSDNLEEWEVIGTGVSEEDALDIVADKPGQRRGQYYRVRKAPEGLPNEE